MMMTMMVVMMTAAAAAADDDDDYDGDGDHDRSWWIMMMDDRYGIIYLPPASMKYCVTFAGQFSTTNSALPSQALVSPT